MSQCICVNQSSPKKILSVLNYGNFIASVRVDYEHQCKRYEFHNYDLVVFQEFRIEVPEDATNVIFKVWATDIFRGQYLVFDIKYQVAEDSAFLLWGLSLAAQFKPIPCTAPGILKNILPPAALVPHDSISNGCSLTAVNLATNYASESKCLCAPNIDTCCMNNPCCINKPRYVNKPCCVTDPCSVNEPCCVNDRHCVTDPCYVNEPCCVNDPRCVVDPCYANEPCCVTDPCCCMK